MDYAVCHLRGIIENCLKPDRRCPGLPGTTTHCRQAVWCNGSFYTGHAARFKPVMLRAVAASRKSPWNDLNPDILDSATGAHNDGVRLPCPFRYAVVLARLPCRRGSFDRLSYRKLRQAQQASTSSATVRPVAEPAEAKHQGLRSWTRRKPKLLTRRDDDVTLRRSAERAENRLLLQEPPRKTNLEALQLVRALPSIGAPV